LAEIALVAQRAPRQDPDYAAKGWMTFMACLGRYQLVEVFTACCSAATYNVSFKEKKKKAWNFSKK
jgi:hypothetical protein